MRGPMQRFVFLGSLLAVVVAGVGWVDVLSSGAATAGHGELVLAGSPIRECDNVSLGFVYSSDSAALAQVRVTSVQSACIRHSAMIEGITSPSALGSGVFKAQRGEFVAVVPIANGALQLGDNEFLLTVTGPVSAGSSRPVRLVSNAVVLAHGQSS